MIHSSAQKLAILLASKNIIESQKIAIYAYGLELMLSATIGILLLIVVSIILDSPFLWIPYLLGYILFRTNVGGFHAKSHKRCILTFLLLYCILLIAKSYLLFLSAFPLVVSLLTLFPVIHYAPLNVKNNPLSAFQKKKRRKISLIVSLSNMLISLVGVLFQVQSSWFTIYYLGVMAASLLFIFAIIQSKLERRKQE